VHVDTTWGEVIGQYVSFFCALLATSLICVQIYVSRQPLEVLNSLEFKEKWGFLYKDFKDSSKMSMMANFIYTSRRLILMTIAFALRNRAWLQVMLTNIVNLVFACYFMHYQPHLTRVNNQYDLFNEVSVVMLSIIYYGFTEMVNSGRARAINGYVFNAIIVLGVIVNVQHFFVATLLCMLLYIKKWWNRLAFRLGWAEEITYLRPAGAITWLLAEQNRRRVKYESTILFVMAD